MQKHDFRKRLVGSMINSVTQPDFERYTTTNLQPLEITLRTDDYQTEQTVKAESFDSAFTAKEFSLLSSFRFLSSSLNHS